MGLKEVFSDLCNVVGRRLIDVIIEPIGVKELRGGAPANNWGLAGVIVGKIVLGNVDWQPPAYIPKIFLRQSVRIVFRMSGNKEAAVVLALDGKNSCLFRDSQHL